MKLTPRTKYSPSHLPCLSFHIWTYVIMSACEACPPIILRLTRIHFQIDNKNVDRVSNEDWLLLQMEIFKSFCITMTLNYSFYLGFTKSSQNLHFSINLFCINAGCMTSFAASGWDCAVMLKNQFLVACYATLHLALSVRRSVRPSHFTFFGFLRSMASLLLPKWSSDLKYGPCPPARDWGSRVSGLVLSYSYSVIYFFEFAHLHKFMYIISM